MKKLILGLLFLQLFWVIFWYFGYVTMFDLPPIERQTYSLMTGIKFLTLIALYIAWRVTPDSKE